MALLFSSNVISCFFNIVLIIVSSFEIGLLLEHFWHRSVLIGYVCLLKYLCGLWNVSWHSGQINNSSPLTNSDSVETKVILFVWQKSKVFWYVFCLSFLLLLSILHFEQEVNPLFCFLSKIWYFSVKVYWQIWHWQVIFSSLP